MRPVLAATVLIACLPLPGRAQLAESHASAAEDEPLQVTVLETVQLPWQRPEVIVRARRAVTSLTTRAQCGDAVAVRNERAALSAGKAHSLVWQAVPGELRCDIAVGAVVDGQNVSVHQKMTIKVLPELRIEMTPADVDLDARRLRITPNRPLAFVELSLYGLDGQVLHRANQNVERTSPGPHATLQWPELPEPVAKVDIRAFGRDDSWAELSWEPIQLELPHEPLYFGAEQWALSASEHKKLDAAIGEAKRQVGEHRGAKGAGVYVLGLHDGEQQLMEKRAGTVARYFKRRGVRVPVYVGTAQEPGQAAGEVLPIFATQAPARATWRRVR